MAAMDQLLTEIVAVLMAEELVTLKRVAQDGMRVRASAGLGSFHRQKKLEPAFGGPGGGRCCGRRSRSSNWLSNESIPTTIAASENEQPGSGRQRPQPSGSAKHELRRHCVPPTAGVPQLPEVQAAKERQARHAGKERSVKLKESRVSLLRRVYHNHRPGCTADEDGGWRLSTGL